MLTAVLAVACVVVAASCSGSPAASPFRPPAVVRSSTPWAASDGPRPILIDTDLDVDDLVAIAILAGDPAVDVRAVTVAGTGIVHCDPGVDLAARWLAALGRADVPVACGPETAGPGGRSFPSEWRARADAGFGLRLPPLARATDHVSARALIGAAVEKAHGDLVVVAIGPWTNLADAIRTDASVAARIGAVHAMIGAIDVPGNVEMGDTSAKDGVEWNAGADPDAVSAVLGSDVPVSIVPLDASAALPLTRELMWETGGVGAGTGADLVSQLYLRNPGFATEGQSLWDSLTALLLGEPALAAWEDVRLTLTTSGEAAGRLARSEAGRPVRVAYGVDPGLAIERWLAALTRTAVPLSPDGSGALRLNGPAPAAGSPAATR